MNIWTVFFARKVSLNWPKNRDIAGFPRKILRRWRSGFIKERTRVAWQSIWKVLRTPSP